MASDRQRFEKMGQKWNRLYDEGAFSVPATSGKVAVISCLSTYADLGTGEARAEIRDFQREAREFTSWLMRIGVVPELAIDANMDDIKELVQDPYVTGMITIGNGTTSSLFVRDGIHLDADTMSAWTTHLKRGVFVQRQCGRLRLNLNVPLGLPLMSDPRSIFAAPGHNFNPRSIYDKEENGKMRRIFTAPVVGYSAVKRLTPNPSTS